MTKENRDYLEMTFRSIQCFADDGVLQVDELDRLVAIALRDGVVDANEQRVLKNIFGRLRPTDLTDELRARIEQIRAQHGF
ncbi:hypothetical protein [Thiosocius teredinicola]|uniref:hypothetical protein n=1 Tax=Thiosocius teredinicola TaxID=1973002 RepID=UPI0009913538